MILKTEFENLLDGLAACAANPSLVDDGGGKEGEGGEDISPHVPFMGPPRAEPCRKCSETLFWKDPYGKVRCAFCEALPRNRVLVTRYLMVTLEGGQARMRSVPPFGYHRSLLIREQPEEEEADT